MIVFKSAAIGLSESRAAAAAFPPHIYKMKESARRGRKSNRRRRNEQKRNRKKNKGTNAVAGLQIGWLGGFDLCGLGPRL